MRKKILFSLVVSAAIATMLVGCGKTKKEAVVEVTPVEETVEEDSEPVDEEPLEERGDIIEDESVVATEIGDEGLVGFYPCNRFEDRIGKGEFESYDEIISLLNEDDAYAYVTIMGMDEPVLLVSGETFDNGDGTLASIEATPYTMKSSGVITADSMFTSGGTANPIATDKDGVVYCATHHTIDKQCYGDNGTENKSVMMLASVYVESFDDNGDPATVGGFIRETNTLIDNDGRQIEEDEIEAYDKMFAEYAESTPIKFERVK